MSQETLYVTSIDSSHEGGLIETEFQIGSRKHSVYFKSNDIALTGNVEAFLTAALLPCMREGCTLVTKEKVSQRFLKAIPEIMNIFCNWEPLLHKIQVKNAIPVTKAPSKEHRIGAFFSGGVDSFYTFLKHRDEVTDLILLHGFDIKLSDHSLSKRTSEMIRKVASGFGKRVIEVETNLGAFVIKYGDWGRLSHGTVLAGVGHLLFPHFSRIYIASSYSHDTLFPWGSHPDLDPLWSTESLEFIHDGCEASRIDKVALLAHSDIALQHLRVCFRSASTALNCGQCEKCLRTMLNLAAVGALDRCTAFETPLDSRNVRKIAIYDEHTRIFVQENLKAFEKKQGDEELCEALRYILNRPAWRTNLLRRFRRDQRKVGKHIDKYLKRDKRTYDLNVGKWH